MWFYFRWIWQFFKFIQILIFLFIFSSVIFAHLDEKKNKLLEIQKKVKILEEKIRSKEKKEKKLLKELRKIKKQLKTLTKQQKKMKNSIEEIKKDLATIKIKKEALEKTLFTTKQYLYQRLFAIYYWYCLGKVNILPIDNLKQTYLTTKYLQQIIYHDYKLFEKYQSLMENIQLLEKQKSEKIKKLDILLKQVEESKSQIFKEKQKKKALLKKIKQEKKQQKRKIAALKTSAQQLEDLIKRLKKEKIVPQKIKKGSLDWPVNGKIVIPFGKYLDKNTSTYLNSNGIEIQVPYGTPFKAVTSGKVVFADKLQGYEYVIILDHGGGYYTLYGNAISLYKKVGDWVNAGEVLGKVGRVGAEGVTLYFELRYKEKPINPFRWLKPPS